MSDNVVQKSFCLNTPSLVGFGILVLEASGDCVHLGPSLFQSDPGFQACDAIKARMITAILPICFFRHWINGRPQAAFIWKSETGWCYSHDGVWLVVECDRLINDVGIAAESRLPKRIAQHNDVWSAWFVFAFVEEATLFRLKPQRPENRRGHVRTW